MTRAEKLLREIDPSKQYPYQFVCYRITDFRPEGYADLVIPGADLADDLRLMIQSLSVQTPLVLAPVNEDGTEPLLTLEDISKRWNVSTKTVRRWSKLGLIG